MKAKFLSFGVLAAGAILLLSSCDKKEDGSEIDNSSPSEFVANIQENEYAEITNATKSCSDGGSRVLWILDDRIALFKGRDVNEEYKVKKLLTGGTSAALEKVSGEVIAPSTFDANIAYYPYSESIEYAGDNSNHAISVNIPSTQNYKENSFGEGALPMIAVTKSRTDDDLAFKNIFGLLRINLRETEFNLNIRSIKVSGNNNEKLSGAATVYCANNGTPTIEFKKDANNYVVLDCRSVSLNAQTPTDFWIALPPVTFSEGITVEIETDDDVIVRKTTSPLIIARSKIKPMKELKISNEKIYYSFASNEIMSEDGVAVVSLALRGQDSGGEFRAPKEIRVPFKVISNSVEGKDFSIDCTEKEFVFAPGNNSAEIKITRKSADYFKLNIEVDKTKIGNRYKAGNFNTISIIFPDWLNMYSSLVGTWQFLESPSVDDIKEWFEVEDDDPALLPLNNNGFTVTFVKNEDGSVTFKPNTTGDLAALFRESKIKYKKIEKNSDGKYSVNIVTNNDYVVLSDYCTLESSMFYEREMKLTYFSLDRINRAFSKTTENIGPGVIAMRINNKGTLEIHLRDYDKPPFGHNWWYPEKVDWEMFGFIYIFKKVQ